jgi:hypothetical protein
VLLENLVERVRGYWIRIELVDGPLASPEGREALLAGVLETIWRDRTSVKVLRHT